MRRWVVGRSGYTSPALQIIDPSPEEVSMWVVVWIQPINKFSIGLLAGGANFFISARNSYPRDTCHRKLFPLVLYIPPQPDLPCELKDQSDVLIRTIFLFFFITVCFLSFIFFFRVVFSLLTYFFFGLLFSFYFQFSSLYFKLTFLDHILSFLSYFISSLVPWVLTFRFILFLIEKLVYCSLLSIFLFTCRFSMLIRSKMLLLNIFLFTWRFISLYDS